MCNSSRHVKGQRCLSKLLEQKSLSDVYFEMLSSGLFGCRGFEMN